LLSKLDLNYLDSVNNLSIKNLGLTGVNPSVACLIVDYKHNSRGVVLSYGVTSKSGRPHAEINALNKVSNYQINRAKAAIARGSIFGVGAGKSSMKYILPQSTSDFIFSIVTEEYGLFVALIILLLYVILLFRIVIVSQKSNNYFGKLLALAVGLPIVFQALINMGVAVQLFPVTGQPLPLISTGGTSIWTTFFAFGVLLSVSRNKSNIMELDFSENVNE